MKKFILGIVVLAMLVAFSAPAMAATRCMSDIVTREQGTITNGTVIAIEGDGTSGPWTINLPSGDVEMAYVHVHTWGNSGGTPNHRLRFENGNGVVETIDITDCVHNGGGSVSGAWASGFSPDNGTTHVYWKVNATEGSNNFTILQTGVIYEKWFVAVINETSEGNRTHQGHWWHNFGLQDPNFGVNYSTLFYNASSNPINTDVNHTLWTAQSHINTFSMYFNDQFVDNRSTGSSLGGGLEKFSDLDNIDDDGSQKATWKDVVDTGAQYMYVYTATLAETIPLGEPKLDPIDIEFPKMMRSNTNYTINATIKNTGDAASDADTATLYVNGVENGTANIPAGLDPGDSTTVSFSPDVNLSKVDCYEFKVVVASCSNELVEDYQVGYVIVVENDSDFADLVNDTGMPSGSVTYDSGTDTYYIQDLTITNCEGDGISIEGTTKNFVVKNCTVENCAGGGSGVFLNDVTKGTVTECTLQNNEDYGIELGLVPLDSTDPKNVNITCNTIYRNGMSTSKNGIDLIGYNCTVCGNTIRDNGEYGIYVHGNDNKLCNNIIEGNTNYGMKVYNSTGNRICWNNFTDNNGSVTPQGYDNTGTNTWNHVNESYPYGAVYTNYTGNYWDDHTSPDADGDGIVDTSYALDGGAGAADSYPLMTLPWIFNVSIYKNGSDVMNLFSVPLQSSTLEDVIGDNAANGDRVCRYVNGPTGGYKCALYLFGSWSNTGPVEPIEPGVGYEYYRQGVTFYWTYDT